MDDHERQRALREKLDALDGVSEHLFRRVSRHLDRASREFGLDAEGRLEVAMFDARPYDIESFDARNEKRFKFHYIAAPLGLDTVSSASGHRAVCIFVNDSADARVVEELAGRGVQLLALRCAGFNNVDLEACEKLGVSVVRVPEYSPYAVAEHTVALMLMLNRRLHQAYVRNRAGAFVLDGLTGFDMRGKTVGVVGTGKIGRVTAEILLGFGCRILAYDKFPNAELGAREGVRYADLAEIARESDIITLHVPLFPETHHLIDADAIAHMKDGVMIINTSRGGLVDTRALIEGLKSGKISAGGLDVYEEEAGTFFRDLSSQVLTDDVLARLLTFPNVVVTSHQAFLTHEALCAIADTTLASLAEFQAGKRGAELTHAVSAG
ncbi:MAG: 2-hydroxyacid dehydrogenase [Myxococcota bacterium]|nr:2-hydroxyacid dehydrogenase [Myxococcota bacterium]